MRKFLIAVLICSVSLCIIFSVEIGLYKIAYNTNREESERLLKVAYNMIEEESYKNKVDNLLHSKFVTNLMEVSETTESNICDNTENNILCDIDIIGVLIIPKLQIEAPIKEGTTQEVMRTSIGHFVESNYWNGNVALASHNSGTNAHYFEKIGSLNIGDEVKYITKLGIKRYKIESLKQIESTDWSMVVKNDSQSIDEKNTITLITCISGKTDCRLCVRGVEL